MFYSHTFLARKGPLGTVWCAAHLQHKLKKSHYVSTNVPSTVERIIYPEVPIALRMSGHLLLGVVRIYSKQVDYLYEDCNEIWITINRVFTTASVVNVNLPNNANQASFYEDITLPRNFNLDTLELDYDYPNDWAEDSHLLRQEDITLTEQIPSGRDPFIVIRFDEHDLSSSSTEDNNRLGFDDTNDGNTAQNSPSVERRRDATKRGYDFNNLPILHEKLDKDQINGNKEKYVTPTLNEETVVPPDNLSDLSDNDDQEQHPPARVVSPRFVHESPPMKLKPTPIVVRKRKAHESPPMKLKPTPTVAVRKRKQHFDERVVLSNKYIQNMVKNTKDIIRRKHERLTIKREGSIITICPFAIIELHKRLRIRKLEDALYDPFITGSCADLQNLYKDDFVAAKLVTTEETNDWTRSADNENGNLSNNDFASPDRGFLQNDMEMDLEFLEQDGSSATGSQGTADELQQLSSRTRSLAQYLERQSSSTLGNNRNEPPEDLSLNKILEGKSKKTCSRMFYETLVLKSYGLIDVNQEYPYDDIILKITPKLSKAKFSA